MYSIIEKKYNFSIKYSDVFTYSEYNIRDKKLKMAAM